MSSAGRSSEAGWADMGMFIMWPCAGAAGDYPGVGVVGHGRRRSDGAAEYGGGDHERSDESHCFSFAQIQK